MASAQYWNSGSLAGKSAIVTGAAKGIGRGIVDALTERGASVLLTDIDQERLEEARTELAAAGRDVRAIAADITLPDSAQQIVEAAITEFGHLDALINNAVAGNPPTPFIDLTDADYARVFNSGPYATFLLMKQAYPHLQKNGGGSIINFASGAGAAGEPLFGAYAGAKEAIRGLSKVATIEWGADNIRVNSIAPFALSEGAAGWKQTQPEAFARVMSTIPLKRIGDVHTDVGAMVSFLVGDDSTYLTGQTFFVDGGKNSIR